MVSERTGRTLTISRNRRSTAVVVVAVDAPEPEQCAAAELAHHLHLVTGGDFPVTTDARKAPCRLLVGEGAARLADPRFSASRLDDEELLLKTVGRDLILAGGRPRGTLYAVYTFLEDVVGCRWWTPQAHHIPAKPTLIVKRLNRRIRPTFEYREPFWFAGFDPEWAARNRCNGISAGGDAGHGGKHVYCGFVHTFYELIPPGKYFQDHPEWFSELEGKRTADHSQLCLSNEAMRAELVRNLKERLRKEPTATIASVSQTDIFSGNCQCAACRTIDRKEGSPSGLLLRFVNAVAEEIEQEFPHVAIDTLAYLYTRKPCRLTRPRHNVIVRLCSIECSFGKPLSHPRNRAFLEDLEGWSKICKRLYIWDYTTNFWHYVQPHPNLHVLGPNIRLFARHGVRGVFEQGAYQSPGAEMEPLRAWVLAKLLWNPALSPKKLIDEFVTGYYGPAARRVRQYIERMQISLETMGDWLRCYSPPEAHFLSVDVLSEGWTILQAAQKDAGRDKEIRRRVQAVQMPIVYVVLQRWKACRDQAYARGIAWPFTRPHAVMLEEFLDWCRREGVTHLAERATVEQAAEKLRAQVTA